MSRTFDAGQMVLELQGAGEPITAWPTAALLRRLCELLLAPPWLELDPEARLTTLVELTTTIEDRGLDVSAIIRLGLIDRFMRAFMTGIMVGSLVLSIRGQEGTQSADDAGHGARAEFLRQWATVGEAETRTLTSRRLDSRVLGLLIDEDAPYLLRTDSEMRGRPHEIDPKFRPVLDSLIDKTSRQLMTPAATKHLLEWIGAAPLESLLAWQNVEVPAAATMAHHVEYEVVTLYRWLVDRLALTYLADWNSESLLLEWRWVHGELAAPFEVAVLDEREVDPLELNNEIARRSVRGPTLELRLALDQAKDQALKLLKSGDRRSAAELFRRACHRWPNSSEAHNNLGFCLLPDDPTEAVAHLTQSGNMDLDQQAPNAVNLMQAHLLNGESRLALNRVPTVWENWEASTPIVGAWHWVLGRVPELLFVPDSRLPVLLLAAEAATRLGLSVADEWRDRHANLCMDSSCNCLKLVPGRIS
ncbi:hypothetical protein ACFXPS_05525 [Nocardia sp. NPDC059091]|uniref:hypothetical protein n=1 Tax=unclassified Nocardia TaxID=2637762 RepID=UPI0036B8D429